MKTNVCIESCWKDPKLKVSPLLTDAAFFVTEIKEMAGTEIGGGIVDDPIL